MTATWTPLQTNSRSLQSVQALSEAAPTLATEGIDLTGLGAIVPVLYAPNGQTFTGAGTLLGYYYNTLLGQWVRLPRLDDDMADATGLAVVAFPSIPVLQSGGRFALICSAVGVSGGTAVTLQFIVSERLGGVVL
jgi:hypothetical protein